jgi:hypothetical protein
MKILITESQENTIIEELLKGRFPEIVSVKFRSYGNKQITVTEISVYCDMDGYVTGEPIKKSYKSHRRMIWEFLENVVGLDLSSYGSAWHLWVYNLEPKVI